MGAAHDIYMGGGFPLMCHIMKIESKYHGKVIEIITKVQDFGAKRC